MGVVYLVSDLLLSRDVAMKVLHDTTHPVAAWRFVEESQIASQLQHPGVVPIYDFGKLPEGQPFLTMKLVRGKTLSTLNKERPFAERKEAAVEIFFKICQTMAFAHARMVIHRDLKPSNIMMGSFGEVQVVDWGLSKCLESVDCDVSSESDSKIRSKETPISEDKVEVSDPTEVLTSLASHSVSRPSDSPTTGNSSHSKGSQEVSLDPIPEVRSPRRSAGHSPYRHQGLSSETRSGSVLGTLAYMPPEQARGEVDQLDQTADVFALGGILAYLLTGSASYVAKDSETLRSMAVRGDLTECFERLEQSQCGEELDEIVGKCLALAPKDRYRDAGELAERISNFRNRAAERLKAAELEKAASNARAAEATRAATAEKRRRRSTTLLAIVLGVAAILGSAGGLVFQRKQNALSEAEWNNRKLVREKQFEESIREQSLKGRIENELAIGENELANSDSIEPTPNQIDRAKLSIDRVIDMLGRSKNPKSLEARLQALSARWDNLRKTRTVLREIDSLLIDSTQIQETSDEIAVVDSNSSLPTKATIDVPASLASMHDFGLQLQESTEQEDYSTLRHLPSWARPRIQIFLHQLRNAIAADSFYVDVDEDQWKILDRGLIQSVKGAELEQWEDGSIESFGKNPLCDVYEFEFDISTSDFDRLRIEAMPGTDGMGPESGKLTSLGRAEDGSAAMTDLRLSWIDATGTEVDLPILASAATYCFEGEPLGLRNWNLTFSPQQTQHAYFRIDNSGVRSEDEVSGKLRILFKNHSEAEWGDQNFARVRLSIGKSLQSKFVKTPLEVLLNRLSEDESDDWRKRFWNLLTTSNSAEMLELASDPSIHEQPIDLVIELAEQLTKAGTTDAVRTAVSDSNWIIKEPKISSVVEASVDDQGWINLLSSGPYYTTLDFLHELPKGAIPTAIRIETTAPRDDESAIREWDEIVISGREKLTRGLRSLEASQVLYDHRRIAGSTLDAAFDRNSRTSWKVAHPSGQEVCTLLINLKSNTMVEYEDSLRIKLDSNAGVSDPSKRVNHFRVSWTFDNLEWFETEKIAQDLLKQSYLRSPSNSRLLMALSNHLINYSKTSINEALAYATAAVASRPDDPSVLEKYVDLSLKQELSGDSDLFQRAAAMAERHGRLSGKSNAIDQMFNSYTRWARKSFRARRFDEAVAFYKTSQELQPDRFAAHIDLGMSHLRENQLNEAELAFDAGIQSAPNDAEGYTAMSSLRVQQGRYEDAETLLKKAIELEPNVSDHLRQLANCYAARENWEQCLTTYRAFMATGGSKVIGTRAMAWLLSDLGRDEEALNQFRKLVELEPSYPNRFSLALCIMQVEGKEMMWEQCDRWVDNDGDEQLLSTASALSRNALVGWYLHDLPILKETEDASRRRPPRHRLYSLTNLRAVVDWVLERDDTQRKDLLVSAAAWLEMNEFEKAIEDAERYDNAKKANFMMLNPLISNAIRASALHRLDQTEEAIAHCKKFLDSPTTIGGNFQEAINSWFREHPAMVELKEILDAREEAANSPDEE